MTSRVAFALALLAAPSLGCRGRSTADAPADVPDALPAAAEAAADEASAEPVPQDVYADPAPGEPGRIRSVSLRPIEVPGGFEGDQVAVTADGTWVAAGWAELRWVSDGQVRSLQNGIPDRGERLVPAAEGDAVHLGTRTVRLDGDGEIEASAEVPPGPPCGGLATDHAVATPDGRRFVVARSERPSPCLLPDGTPPPERPLENELLLLDSPAGEPIARRELHGMVALDASAERVALIEGETLAILSTEDLATVATLPFRRGMFAEPRFSPDGTALAVTTSDGVVWAYETSGWAIVARKAEAGRQARAALHPRLPLLALCGSDVALRVWALDDAEMREVASVPASPGPPGGPCGSIAFSPDGRRLLVARGGGKVDAFEVVVDSTIRPGERPWEALAAFVRRDARGRPLPPDVLARMGDPGEGNGERIGDLIFAPAGLRAVDRRGRATAWPERVGMDSRREEPEYEHLALAPDASFVARAARDATVLEIADPATGRVRARVDLGQRIQVLRAGPGVAAVGAFGVAGLYDPDGREIRVHRHDTTVTALALSADGRRFASCDIDNVSLVSDLASEAPPVRIRDRRRYARDARLSADGARLYLAHFGGTAAVWDLAAGETIRTLDAGPATGDRIAVAPDESRLAVGGNEVALFDLGDESVRRIDLALGADILRFDDAGARLLTVSRYGGAQLWDAADGTALPTAPGHTAKVAELIVLPDGDTVLAADQEGNLFRWSVATGEGTFLGYASGLLGIAAAPDGTIRRVFAGGSRPFALDAAEHRVAWRTEDAGDAAAASPDGSRLVVARRGVGADRGNARIERLNPEDGTVPETVPFPPAGRVEAIQVGNDGRLTARCDQALWRRPPGGEWEPVAEGIAVTSRDSISADGRFRWVSDGDAARRIDLETATVDELPGFRTYGGTGCLSDDGERLALVMHPDVVVLDVATAAERLRFEPQDGAVVSAAFFPGGDRLAVGMDDRTILVLEVPAAAPRADGPRGTGPRAGGT